MIKENTENVFSIKIIAIGLTMALVVAMILLAQHGLGEVARVLCMFYTFATGVFFLAQLYGFIICQTDYSDEVEAPKFTMLENEEKEWQLFQSR